MTESPQRDEAEEAPQDRIIRAIGDAMSPRTPRNNRRGPAQSAAGVKPPYIHRVAASLGADVDAHLAEAQAAGLVHLSGSLDAWVLTEQGWARYADLPRRERIETGYRATEDRYEWLREEAHRRRTSRQALLDEAVDLLRAQSPPEAHQRKNRSTP
jgi:hypothetical protein